VVVFLLLSAILHFSANSFSVIYHIAVPNSIKPILMISFGVAVFYGVVLDFLDFYFYRKWFKGKST